MHPNFRAAALHTSCQVSALPQAVCEVFPGSPLRRTSAQILWNLPREYSRACSVSVRLGVLRSLEAVILTWTSWLPFQEDPAQTWW